MTERLPGRPRLVLLLVTRLSLFVVSPRPSATPQRKKDERRMKKGLALRTGSIPSTYRRSRQSLTVISLVFFAAAWVSKKSRAEPFT
jgi:hypothetical protein